MEFTKPKAYFFILIFKWNRNYRLTVLLWNCNISPPLTRALAVRNQLQ